MTPEYWELRGNEMDDHSKVFHTIFGNIHYPDFTGQPIAMTQDACDGRLIASSPRLLTMLEQNIHHLPPCDETTAIKKLASWIRTGTVQA